MSGFYRKKKNAASFLLKDKNFYIILTVSLIMVCVSGYLALGWDSSPNIEDQTHDSVNSGDDSYNPSVGDSNVVLLDPNYVPDWDEEDLSANVSSEAEGVPETPDETDADTDPTDGEEDPEEVSNGVLTFISPVEVTEILSVNDYSGTMPVFSETLGDWRLHQGIDIITDLPVDVVAAANGIVEDIYEDGLMGTTVLISHPDGTKTVYQSLSPNLKVLKNMEVRQGDIIGKTSSSAEAEASEGVHLHFLAIRNGAYIDPNSLIGDSAATETP